MLKGFKDFLMRGNVVDLAVAVVIGAAFTAVVTAFTEKLLNPLIASFGGVKAQGLGFRIVSGNPATFLDFGAVITAIVNFVIVAAVVYFLVVLPMNRLSQRLKKGEEPEVQAPTPDVLLLQEIRDILRTRNGQV
ncbi:MAG: large conductance mechanosensitive channel protein MscL [Actinomycetes bacterium]